LRLLVQEHGAGVFLWAYLSTSSSLPAAVVVVSTQAAVVVGLAVTLNLQANL
jgi:hypothetical protein